MGETGSNMAVGSKRMVAGIDRSGSGMLSMQNHEEFVKSVSNFRENRDHVPCPWLVSAARPCNVTSTLRRTNAQAESLTFTVVALSQ